MLVLVIADEKDAFDDALAAEIEISVLGLWPRILGYSCLGAALLSEENCDVTTNYSFFIIYLKDRKESYRSNRLRPL